MNNNIGLERGLPAVDLGHEALDALEALEHAREYVRDLGERELLPDTDARPAVERDVLPGARLPREPAVRAELVRVRELVRDRRVQVRPPLHHERRVPDRCVLEHGDGLGAVCAAAAGQRRVLQGHAQVEWYYRVEPQYLVDHVLKVLHALEVFVCGRAREAQCLHDLVAQLPHDLWMASKFIYRPL